MRWFVSSRAWAFRIGLPRVASQLMQMEDAARECIRLDGETRDLLRPCQNFLHKRASRAHENDSEIIIWSRKREEIAFLPQSNQTACLSPLLFALCLSCVL